MSRVGYPSPAARYSVQGPQRGPARGLRWHVPHVLEYCLGGQSETDSLQTQKRTRGRDTDAAVCCTVSPSRSDTTISQKAAVIATGKLSSNRRRRWAAPVVPRNRDPCQAQMNPTTPLPSPAPVRLSFRYEELSTRRNREHTSAPAPLFPPRQPPSSDGDDVLAFGPCCPPAAAVSRSFPVSDPRPRRPGLGLDPGDRPPEVPPRTWRRCWRPSRRKGELDLLHAVLHVPVRQCKAAPAGTPPLPPPSGGAFEKN